MLVLRRNDGEWVEITHHSGEVIRIRIYDLHAGNAREGVRPWCRVAFDDAPHNFRILREEIAGKDLTPKPCDSP